MAFLQLSRRLGRVVLAGIMCILDSNYLTADNNEKFENIFVTTQRLSLRTRNNAQLI